MHRVSDQVRFFSCETDACPDAPPSRREFLQSAGCLGMTLALVGLPSTPAHALPVFLTEGTEDGGERRYPIPATDSVNVDRTAQLIVARVQGHLYVFALSCPHQNNAVKW